MDKIDASNLLRTNLGAPATEVEAAYRKRNKEVRKHFETARDRNTRTRCEREYLALEEARNFLLAEPDDLIQQREELPAEREAFLVEREEPPAGREAFLDERKEPPAELEPASVEREEPTDREKQPVERVWPAIDGVSPPIKRVSGPTERVSTPIERVSRPIERVSTPIERVSTPIERVSRPIEHVSSPNGRVSPPKEPEPLPLTTASAQGRGRPTQKQWLAITGVIFILVLASAIVFFLPHTPEKPKQGKLVLNTVPDNAHVWLDGVSRGKTPLVLEDVAPGDHRLKIELRGYEPEQLIVSVKPGDEGSTRIVQFPSPKPTATQSPTSRPEPTIVPPTVAASERPLAYPGEQYPQTRERLLTEADVANLDYAELRYAINEMYARYGAPFLSQPDIEKQFRTFPWYHPIYELRAAQIEASFFSAIEKKNIDILARLRDQKRPK